MKYAKGIMWLDDCRIPFVDSDKETINFDRPRVRASVNEDWILKQAHDYTNPEHKEYNQQGRFTPNLLVCDDMLNDGVITQYNKTREDKGNYLGGHRKEYVGTTDNDVVKQIKGQFFSDKGSNSRYYDLDKWFDKIIDNL
jgi:hypothetical protein